MAFIFHSYSVCKYIPFRSYARKGNYFHSHLVTRKINTTKYVMFLEANKWSSLVL